MKAEWLMYHFESKQSSNTVNLPLTRDILPSMTSFAFEYKETNQILCDLDEYGRTD